MSTDTPSLIGVVSDSHDQVHYLERVVAFFNRKQVRMVIHCGDWVAPFTLSYFSKLNAPLYGIFGNNDGEKFGHARVAQRLGLALTMEDQFLGLLELGKRIAVYHGTAPQLVDALIKCGDYDVVFYGHNHIAEVELVGNVLVMNPGTLLDVTSPKVQGASIGLYDADAHSGQIFKMDELD